MEDNRFDNPAPATVGAPPPATGIPPPPVPAPAYPAPPAAAVIVEKKSPGLAGVLSAIFPGLGQLYLGIYQRAFTIAAAFVGCIWIVSTGFMSGRMTPLFGMGIAFVWFFGIIDAVRQAKAINVGSIEPSGLATAPTRRAEGTASLTWGVILVGIGTLWLIDRYVDMEWFWELVDEWLAPVAFILLGLVLILTYVIRRRRRNAQEVWPPREP